MYVIDFATAGATPIDPVGQFTPHQWSSRSFGTDASSNSPFPASSLVADVRGDVTEDSEGMIRMGKKRQRMGMMGVRGWEDFVRPKAFGHLWDQDPTFAGYPD